jgi:prolyl-tRNA synthetase
LLLRESPAEAEIASHKLLLRAGLARKVGAGLYTYLPLGLRALHEISELCREELDAAGVLELWMPHLHPAEFWRAGPCWGAAREIMFRVHHARAGKRAAPEPELVSSTSFLAMQSESSERP